MRICFLGSGAAEGSPAISCHCEHCDIARRKGGVLERKRGAVLFDLPDYKLLVDAPPDIRELLNSNGIKEISGIFLTHEHFDHVGELKEFLYWNKQIDFFAEPEVFRRVAGKMLRQELNQVAFHFAFHPGVDIIFQDFSFTPFEVRHTVPCYGLIIYENSHRVVYAADTSNRLSNYSLTLIRDADVLILNTPFSQKRWIIYI